MITAAVVNELSLLSERTSAADRVVELVGVVVSAVSHEKRFALENWPPFLASGLPALADPQRMVGEARRDDRVIFLRAASRSRGLTVSSADPSVYSASGIEGRGLAIAVVFELLLLSCSGADEWRRRTAEVRVVAIEDDSAGADDVVESSASIPNASSTSDFEYHAENARSQELLQGVSSETLWKKRAQLLPRLHLLADVERQMARLDATCLDSVCTRLNELNLTMEYWARSEGEAPVWRSKVTPESESRESLCRFADDHGEVHVYSLHARYTPGPGRVHFRLLDGHRLEIAYVGRKLGV